MWVLAWLAPAWVSEESSELARHERGKKLLLTLGTEQGACSKRRAMVSNAKVQEHRLSHQKNGVDEVPPCCHSCDLRC